MLSLRVLAIALALAAASPAAQAKAPMPPPFRKCAIPQDAKFYDYFRDLPEAIRLDFVQHRGAIAERGDFYNGSDIFIEGKKETVPRRRFVAAVELDHVWVLWYEGMRGRDLLAAYRFFVPQHARPARPPSDLGLVTTSDPCPVVEAFLSGMIVVDDDPQGTAVRVGGSR